jgi:hypothetical protein
MTVDVQPSALASSAPIVANTHNAPQAFDVELSFNVDLRNANTPDAELPFDVDLRTAPAD